MEINCIPYQRLSIYQTKARLYIVGYCKLRRTAALLKLSKQEPTQLDVAEVAGNYSLEEVRGMLSQIHMANAHLGGLQLVTHCCGIIGCFRFTETYYLLLVTRKAHVGTLCGGHKVYTVAATALMPLHPGYSGGAGAGGGAGGQASSAAEKRYVKLLMGMDLTKHFYFSYTYNLSHTVQWNCRMAQQRSAATAAAAAGGHGHNHNHSHGYGPHSHHGGGGGLTHLRPTGGRPSGLRSDPPSASVSGGGAPASPPRASTAALYSSTSVGPSCSSSVYDSMFTWNAYLTSALRRALGGNERWTVPLIHGFWEQRRLSIYGRPLTLTLIARRSRHFAGTRYRKRGLNDGGKVANEVETEQVVDAGIDYRTRTPLLSSVVQVRGSVPLFWSQQLTALSPKPEIILQQFDPLYEVTEAHFADLEARYGAPAVVLNLLKSKERRPREVLLRRELATAIAQLNGQRGRGRPHIVYIPWDFSKHAKQSGSNLLSEIAAITRLALDMTGLFVHNPASPPPQRLLVFGPLSPLRTGSGGGGGGYGGYGSAPASAGVRPIRTTGSEMRRAVGDGGSTMHLAAAAEAAAAAVRARTAAAGVVSGGGAAPTPSFATYSSGYGSGGGGGGGGFARISGFSRISRNSIASAGGATSAGCLSAVQWQSGVLRTNCIDCLDRTNVAQFAFGLVAFGRQLYKLGLHDVRDIDADSSAAFMLMGLYEAMGHVLSLQYGGSEAHTIFFQRKKGEWEAATQSKDLVTSLKRLYSNTYTDAEKQDAINLFLGTFVPHPNQPHIWQLDTDQYLHSETTTRPAPPPMRFNGHGPSLDGSGPSMVPRTSSEQVSAAAAAKATGGAATPPTPSPAASTPATPHVVHQRGSLPELTGTWPSPTAAAVAAAAGASCGGAEGTPGPTIPASGAGAASSTFASSAAAAAAAVDWGSAARFPGLQAESPLLLDVSSDDEDTRSVRSYHDSGGGGDGGSAGGPGSAPSTSGGSSSSLSAAASAAAHYSAAIPFHRAPSSGGFLASLLPSFSGRGGGSGGGGGGGGGGLFERVVASLLQPGGAGAAARSAAAGFGGGDVPGGGTINPARLLISFDQALSRPPNQVWPIRLHGEEDKQGRWAAVQSAFSFFWTTGGGNMGGAGEGSAVARSKYMLDDAPRPPRPTAAGPPTPANRFTSPTSPLAPGSHTPLLSNAPSGFTSLPMSPEASKHGGNANSSAVTRTITAVTEGGVSVLSDTSPRGTVTTATGAAAVAAAATAAATLTAAAAALQGGAQGSGSGSQSRNLDQVLEMLVDADHMDDMARGRGGTATSRTVADMIPALGPSPGFGADGGAGGGGGFDAARYGSGGTAGGGAGTGGDSDDDGAYYYSAADAEAALASQLDGTGGGALRPSVRTVAQMLGSALLSPSGQPASAGVVTGTAAAGSGATAGGAGAAGLGSAGKPQQGGAPGPTSSIPVLNDFIEVAGGSGPPTTDWRVLLMGEEHALSPGARRRAVAEAAARAREEERQSKLHTAGLEVSDLLSLGVEDLGLNWELQPWWSLEPRPRYDPRPHEPHPTRLRAAQEEAQRQQQRERERQHREAEEERERERQAEAEAEEERKRRERERERERGHELMARWEAKEEREAREEQAAEAKQQEGAGGGNGMWDLRAGLAGNLWGPQSSGPATSPQKQAQQQQQQEPGRLSKEIAHDRQHRKRDQQDKDRQEEERERQERQRQQERQEHLQLQDKRDQQRQEHRQRELEREREHAQVAALLHQKQQVEHMALLHYDVAQLHARAKFGDFLAAVPVPYGLYGEERRREVALYDRCCYIEQL